MFHNHAPPIASSWVPCLLTWTYRHLMTFSVSFFFWLLVTLFSLQKPVISIGLQTSESKIFCHVEKIDWDVFLILSQ
ncbi:hypothetical protein HanIR_Chr04g0173741 [Helianthus annuus]|nr:hypothetical protein HanIR_Chr04g0173741 [Helianthus annuus]